MLGGRVHSAPHFRENTFLWIKVNQFVALPLLMLPLYDAGRFKEVKSLSFYQVYPWIVGRF